MLESSNFVLADTGLHGETDRCQKTQPITAEVESR